MSHFSDILNGIQHAFAVVLIELPARSLGMDRLIRRLERSALKIENRAARAKGRPANKEILAHVIGIERWGQRRLRVALGEPFILDECDLYQPAGQEWPDLLAEFQAARQETIALSKSLRMAGVDPWMRVRHNQFGELHLLGWLFYLEVHASLESTRIN